MKIQLFSGENDFFLGKKKWNSLLSNSETSSPFQAYEWFCSWWKVFGSKQDLFIFTARTGKTYRLGPSYGIQTGEKDRRSTIHC